MDTVNNMVGFASPLGGWFRLIRLYSFIRRFELTSYKLQRSHSTGVGDPVDLPIANAIESLGPVDENAKVQAGQVAGL